MKKFDRVYHLIREGSVHLLGRLHEQSSDEGVHAVVLVQLEGFGLVLMKSKALSLPSKGSVPPNKQFNMIINSKF